jgi:hypothetical protein
MTKSQMLWSTVTALLLGMNRLFGETHPDYNPKWRSGDQWQVKVVSRAGMFVIKPIPTDGTVIFPYEGYVRWAWTTNTVTYTVTSTTNTYSAPSVERDPFDLYPPEIRAKYRFPKEISHIDRETGLAVFTLTEDQMAAPPPSEKLSIVCIGVAGQNVIPDWGPWELQIATSDVFLVRIIEPNKYWGPQERHLNSFGRQTFSSAQKFPDSFFLEDFPCLPATRDDEHSEIVESLDVPRRFKQTMRHTADGVFVSIREDNFYDGYPKLVTFVWKKGAKWWSEARATLGPHPMFECRLLAVTNVVLTTGRK